jgi:hypothetical protein
MDFTCSNVNSKKEVRNEDLSVTKYFADLPKIEKKSAIGNEQYYGKTYKVTCVSIILLQKSLR